jgi:hypothetical protein
MATAAILKKVNITKPHTHCGHGFCIFLLQNIHPTPRYMNLKKIVNFSSYQGNGSHFENGTYSKSTYSWRLWFL